MPSGNEMADEHAERPIEPEVQRKPSASNGRGRRRIRARARPNTSTTSPRKLAITRRRAEMLDLREQGHTYDAIAKHFNPRRSCKVQPLCRPASLPSRPAMSCWVSLTWKC